MSSATSESSGKLSFVKANLTASTDRVIQVIQQNKGEKKFDYSSQSHRPSVLLTQMTPQRRASTQAGLRGRHVAALRVKKAAG